MCGFVGIVPIGPELKSEYKNRLVAMCDRIAHRGPDADGYEFSRVGLGHRRLSIIDLEGGAQPMWDAAHQVCLVFNGEIYNYTELAEDLVARGVKFRTSSDTEVLLESYLEFGSACLDRLNGMYSFAIWDEREGSLILARDRLGEKPLYYAETSEGLVFASELKAVLESGLVSREIDQEALSEYLCTGYVPAPLTIYRNVKKLRAGEKGYYTPGKPIRLARYWSPTWKTEAERPTDLESLLRHATKIRLRSDVPVGAFLSGGIDSSLITAYARDEYGPSLQTFCIRFDERAANEAEYAKEVALILGTEHHEIHVNDLNTEVLPELVDQFDEPFADPSVLPTYFVTRSAREHLKVCLSGDGGDEVFGGYTRYSPEPLQNLADHIPPSIRTKLRQLFVSTLDNSTRGKGWLTRMLSDEVDRYLGRVWLFGEQELRELLRNPASDRTRQGRKRFEELAISLRRERADWPMLFDQETYLADNILTKVDRNSMKNSLEVRVPILDHRVVEFANRQSLTWKIRAGELKAPLKELARDRFPTRITQRPKHGFGLPLREWFSTGRLGDQFKDMVLSRNALVHDILDPNTLSAYFDAHNAGKRDFGRSLWGILWLELWLQSNL